METVLVCDDDIAILESIEIYLKAEGFNVLKAESGEQALNIIAQNEIQCLVLDIMMPGIDGLQTTLKIREQKKNFPIIMLSANRRTRIKSPAWVLAQTIMLPSRLIRLSLWRELNHKFADIFPFPVL